MGGVSETEVSVKVRQSEIFGQVVSEKFDLNSTVSKMTNAAFGVVDIGVVAVVDNVDVQSWDVVSINEHGEMEEAREVGSIKTNLRASSWGEIVFSDDNRETFIKFGNMPKCRVGCVGEFESDTSGSQIEGRVPKEGSVKTIPNCVVAAEVFAPSRVRLDKVPNI
jgi:hypothetical protein